MEKPNLNYIKELSGGDLEFEQKILSILKNELPEEIKLYLQTIKDKSLSETAEVVHKIKHKISILGLEKAHSFAEVYENDLKLGKAVKHDEFSKILGNMSQFLAEK